MSFEISSAAGHNALRDAVRDYLTAKGTAFGLTYAGTGDGTLTAYRGGASSVAETFTIQATSATNFTVTGSVSGAQAAATVGTPYATSLIEFTLTAGGTAFVSGDTFLLSTAPPWTNRIDNSTELLLEGPGNDGTSEVMVGIREFEDAPTDYYNWELMACDGYNSGLSWSNQANIHRQLYVPLWQNAIPYWLVANGRRAVVVAKVSTVYVAAYLGLLEPGMSPDVYPYPLALGGSLAFEADPASNSTSWRWSQTTSQIAAFPFADHSTGGSIVTREVQARVRRSSGAWWGFRARTNGTPVGLTSTLGFVAPACNTMTNFRDGPGGDYPLLPVELLDAPANRWGAFEGVYVTSGFAIGAETAITRGLHTYVAFPNIFRAGNDQFFAVKLD